MHPSETTTPMSHHDHQRFARLIACTLIVGVTSIASLLAATAVPSASAATSGQPDMPERLRNRLIKRVAQVVDLYPSTRGYAVHVDVPGVGSFSHAEGSSHPAGLDELHPNDIYRMASVTKTFAAVAVLRLVDAGLVSLDEPVATFVPGCPNGNAITVRDLLGMTSGLADYSVQPGFALMVLLNPAGPFPESEIVASICALTPDAAPGIERVYNNSGYYLLGSIIESVTDRPWQQWIAEHVVGAAGLTQTSFPVDAPLPIGARAGWYYLELPPELGLGPWWDLTDLHPGYAGTAGCGYSTLSDLSTWLDTLLAGDLLSPRVHAAQMDLQPIDDDEYEDYGLGIARFGPWIGHTGVSLGSYAWMLRHVPTGTNVVVFVQCGGEIPHIDLDGMARDLQGWPNLPRQ